MSHGITNSCPHGICPYSKENKQKPFISPPARCFGDTGHLAVSSGSSSLLNGAQEVAISYLIWVFDGSYDKSHLLLCAFVESFSVPLGCVDKEADQILEEFERKNGFGSMAFGLESAAFSTEAAGLFEYYEGNIYSEIQCTHIYSCCVIFWKLLIFRSLTFFFFLFYVYAPWFL